MLCGGAGPQHPLQLPESLCAPPRRLIETSAGTGVPLDEPQQACLWGQLLDNLRHPAPDIQAAGAAALSAYAARYLPGAAPAAQQAAVRRFVSDLGDRSSPPLAYTQPLRVPSSRG